MRKTKFLFPYDIGWNLCCLVQIFIRCHVNSHQETPESATDISEGTVNSLMFAGINVCVFVTKPRSRGLMFAVS